VKIGRNSHCPCGSEEKYKELIMKIYEENPPIPFTKINLSKF